jgi:hypothetical protein
MNDTDLQTQILRRLNILILLELDKTTPGSGSTMTSKVQWLLSMGLSQSEVASIVGKPMNYATAMASTAKKASKKKGQRDG